MGDRLFGAIGHPDLPAMARGLVDTFSQFSGMPASVVAGGLRLGPVADAAARRYGGEPAVGMLRFARLLSSLGRGGGRSTVSTRSGSRRASTGRPTFWPAPSTRSPRPPTSSAAAAAFATSSVEVLPGLGHGWYVGAVPPGATSFERACGAWLVRHLADWTD